MACTVCAARSTRRTSARRGVPLTRTGRKVCRSCLFVADEREWRLELEDLRIKTENLLPKANGGDAEAQDEVRRMAERKLEIIQLLETGRPVQ